MLHNTQLSDAITRGRSWAREDQPRIGAIQLLDRLDQFVQRRVQGGLVGGLLGAIDERGFPFPTLSFVRLPGPCPVLARFSSQKGGGLGLEE